MPFRLNKLYKNDVVKEAKSELKENLKYLKKELLSDLGFTNNFTQKKAEDMAAKLFSKINNNNHPLAMELSKNRNYLFRMNFMHSKQQLKYQSLRESLSK